MFLGSYQISIMEFLFVFPFNLLVTNGYLVDTSGYLVVTFSYLIPTTGYFWLLVVTSRYFWFLVLVTMLLSVIFEVSFTFFKDTHREKAPSNKTPVLTKSMNMGTGSLVHQISSL